MTIPNLTRREKAFACAFALVFSAHAIAQYRSDIYVREMLHGAAGSHESADVLPTNHQLQSGAQYSYEMVLQGVEEKRELLNSSVSVTVLDPEDTTKTATWKLSLAKYSTLVEMHQLGDTVAFRVNTDAMQEMLEAGVFPGSAVASDAVVTDTYDDRKGVHRVKDVSVAYDGFTYSHSAASRIASALREGSGATVQIKAPFRYGTVTLRRGDTETVLSLLSEGRSDYSNSPDARISNVHKAFDERVNNIVVNPGETFSFVAALDAPVTIEKGWKEALGLFGGGTALTPGGGICQAATTVYRAALLAGLPITYKRNHSVFVDHYEPYGVGLDATVFPGVHDLTFKNDTAEIILVQAHTDEATEEGFVRIYGIPDHRTVALDGPYFNITPHRAEQLRPLDWDEIGWVHTVTYPDGTVKEKPIIATYTTGFMRSIKEKYARTPGIILLREKNPSQEIAAAEQVIP